MTDPTELFANNFETTLGVAINASDMSATIMTALPTALQETGEFRLRLGTVIAGEWVTASMGTSAANITMTRGVEGSIAQAWPGGTLVTQLLTAGALQELMLDAVDAATAGVPAVVGASRSITSATTITSSDSILLVDASSSAFSQPLPAAFVGVLTVDAVAANTHLVTLTPHGADTIEGLSSLPLGSQASGATYQSVQLARVGTTWRII